MLCSFSPQTVCLSDKNVKYRNWTKVTDLNIFLNIQEAKKYISFQNTVITKETNTDFLIATNEILSVPFSKGC